MRKKKISERRLVCVMLAVLMLAGCGGKDTARESEKVTLSLMMPQSHYKEFFKEEIGRFEAEYSQYHIEVLRIPDNQWIEVTKAKAATGELTDLVRIDKGLMEDIGTGKFVSIFEYDEEKHMRQVKEEGREEGEAYTLERVNHLIRLLASQSRTEDIVRAASDREWQEKLFKEFGL